MRFPNPSRGLRSCAIGLGAATANSFLFLAGKSAPSLARASDRAVLAYAYSTGRERCYAKEARFVRTGNGLTVLRRPLFDAQPPEHVAVRQNSIPEEA